MEWRNFCTAKCACLKKEIESVCVCMERVCVWRECVEKECMEGVCGETVSVSEQQTDQRVCTSLLSSLDLNG